MTSPPPATSNTTTTTTAEQQNTTASAAAAAGGNANSRSGQPGSSNPNVTAAAATTTTTTASNPKTRLLIHKIKTTNFKSYCGHKTIGPFNTHFSAIIGPNGSGKSNSLDAIQFIFSRKASDLRAAKLSELIYNSGGVKKDFCKVEIVFWVVPVDFSDNYLTDKSQSSDVLEEFVIGRKVKNKKNSPSAYYINQKRATAQEVVELLKKYNVDLDNNRFLILQGEVESIATKSNTELMAYLENVIGSDKYQKRIEVLSEKLDEYREDAAKKNVSAINLENNLRSNNKKFRAALKAAKDRVEIAHCRKHIKFLDHQLRNGKIQESEEVIERLKQKLADLLEKIKRGEETIRESEATIEKEKEELAELRNKHQLCKERERRVTNSIEESKQVQKRKRKRKKRYETTINTSEESLAKLQKEVDSAEEKLNTTSAKISSAKNHLEQAQNSLDAKYAEIEQKLAPIREQITATRKKLVPYQENQQNKQSELDILGSKIEKFTGERQSLHETKENLQQSITQIKERLSNNQDAYNTLNAQLSTSDQKRKELQSQQQQVASQLSKSRDALRRAEGEFNRLRSEESAAKTGNRIYQAVQSRNFPGFHDRVGNLATIDARYNVAIASVFAGPANNLVVESARHFNVIKDYLRQNRLGRATAEDLQMVHRSWAQSANQSFNAPNDSPRLYDLLNIGNPQTYGPVFYKYLRNTLVAPNVDRARELVYKQNHPRVVTLQGEIVDRSTMSSARRGLANMQVLGNATSRVSKEEIQAAKQKYDRLQYEVSQIEGNLNAVKSELEKITEGDSDQRIEREKMENFIKTDKYQCQRQEPQLRDVLQKLTQFTDEKYARMKSEASDLEKQIHRLQQESSSLRDSLSELREQENQLKGEDCTKMEQKVDILRKEIQSLEKERAKSRQSKQSSLKKIKKLKQDVKEAESNTKSLEEELENLEKKLLSLQKESSEVEEKLKELSSLLEEKAEELNADEEHFKKSKEKLRKLKEKNKLGTEEISKYQKMIVHMKEEQEGIAKDLQQCKQKLRDDLIKCPDIHNPFGRRDLEKYSDDEDYAVIQELFEPFKEYFVSNDPKQEDEDRMVDDDEEQNEEQHDEDAMVDETYEAEEPTQTAQEDGTPTTRISTKHVGEISITPPEEALTQDEYDAQVQTYTHRINVAKESLSTNKNNNPELISNYVENMHKAILKRAAADEAQQKRATCAKEHADLCEQRKSLFLEGFSICDKRMRQIFRAFTEEGDAALQLLDPQNPFESGVLFNVRPPGKSWREIQNLSGGEKTLSSLALVFGLHHYRPTPIYIMDEIDAALDFKNVSVIGNYIKEEARNAQFIVISLRNHMFDLADRLVGIYKTHDITKSIVLEPKKIEPQQYTDEEEQRRKRRRLSHGD